jgi:hypothetical protein
MRSRLHLLLLTTAVVVSAAAVAGTAAGAADRKPAKAEARKAVGIPPGNSVIAVARRRLVPIYARRDAKAPSRTLGRGLYGSKRVFLVAGQRRRWTWPQWVRVHLPTRPNGSRGWVRARDVKFLLDPYAVDIDLTRRVLRVRRGTRDVFRARIGVGRDAWPTPTGRYYITELLKAPSPNGAYGPYAFGISAFSSVFTRFGNGPGQVGIHGTNQPWSIGREVSHGCIRLDNRAIVWLAKRVPLGTPVRIVQRAPLPSLRRPPVERVTKAIARTTASPRRREARPAFVPLRASVLALAPVLGRALGLHAVTWVVAALGLTVEGVLEPFWREYRRQSRRPAR